MDQNLTMVRGDTLSFDVKIENIDELDSAFFSVKRDRDSDEYVFQKTLYDGIWKDSSGDDYCIYGVRVAPEDTANIDVRDYYYDMQIRKNGDVFTILRGVLSVLMDVTKDEPFIPAGKEPNDVIFIDYDGEIVYSYSASDFADLEKMPPNPSHQGLTAQGWNWSLTDAKAYVASYGQLIIGQNYITDDGKTRLYITIADEGRMTLPLRFQQSDANGVEVDWGDGTVETFAGTGSKSVSHTYSSIGDYVITLEAKSGTLTIGHGTSSQSIITGTDANAVYRSMLKRVEIGSHTYFSAYCLYDMKSLFTITIPAGKTITNNMLYNCTLLSGVVIPNGATQVNQGFIQQCYGIQYASIPNGVTSIGLSALSNMRAVGKITMPETMTELNTGSFAVDMSLSAFVIPKNISYIGVNAFNSLFGVKYYDFTHHTSIPTLVNSNAFASIPSDCEIRVPASLEDSWKAATNWSDLSSYIVGV